MREARKPQLQKPEDTVNNDALLSIAEAAEKTSVPKKAVVEFVKPPIQESRQVFQVGESVQIPDSEHGFIGGTIVDTVQDGDKFLYVIGFERNERKLNKRISERQLVELQVEQSLMSAADEMIDAVCDAYNVPAVQRGKLNANLYPVARALSDMHPRQAEAAFKEYIRQRAGESDERAGIDAQMEVLAARAHRDGEPLREPLLKHYEEEDVDELHTDLEEVTDNIKKLPDGAIEETGIQLVNDSGEVITQLAGDIEVEDDTEKIVDLTEALHAASGPLALGAGMLNAEAYNAALKWAEQKFEIAPSVVETDEGDQRVARSLPEYFALKKQYENCGVTGESDREEFDDVLEELAASTDPKLEKKRVAAEALIEDIKNGKVVAFADVLKTLIEPRKDVLSVQDAYDRLKTQYENATAPQSNVRTGVDLPTFMKVLDEMVANQPKNLSDTARRDAAIKLKADIESGEIMSVADYQEEIAKNISKGTKAFKTERRAAKNAEEEAKLDAEINDGFNLPRENKISESADEAPNPSRRRGIFSNYKSIEHGGTSEIIDRRTPRVFQANEEIKKELEVEERMAGAEETPVKMRVERLVEYAKKNMNANAREMDAYLGSFEKLKDLTPDAYLELQDKTTVGGFFARWKARRKIKHWDNILNRVETASRKPKSKEAKRKIVKSRIKKSLEQNPKE